MTDEERELSELLERAVPQLPAPAQRLEQVRERARRRRRRRAAAGASATAVVVVAAAGLLLPGLSSTPAGPGQRTEAQSGANAQAGTSPRTPSAPVAPNGPTATGTAPPTTPPGYRLYSFADLAGLRLRIPADWYAFKHAAKDTDYVSTQQLVLPEGGCAHALDDFCTPLLRNLHKGGALVQVKLTHNQGMADKLRAQGWTAYPKQAVTACRAVGGTDQLTVTFPDRSGSDVLIEATACLSQPTAAQRAQVRDVLMTADFS